MTILFKNLITNLFYISLIILIVIFIFYFFFYIKNKRKFLIKISNKEKIKNMTIIALFASTSVALVAVLNVFAPIAIIPMVRMATQSLVIKISGFLFGPIFGVTTALLSEVGILVFVPSYFHIKITIALIGQGIISGLAKAFKDKKKHRFYQVVFLLFFVLFLFFITSFYLNVPEEQIKNQEMTFTGFEDLFRSIKVSFENIKFDVKGFFFCLNLIVFSFIIIVLSLILIYLLLFDKKKSKLNKLIFSIIPILFLTIFSEYFISIGISTYTNQDLFGASKKSTYFLIQSGLVIAPIKLAINTLIIYSVWKVISPLLLERKFI